MLFVDLLSHLVTVLDNQQLEEVVLVARLIILELQVIALAIRDDLQLQVCTLVALDKCKTPFARAVAPIEPARTDCTM